MFLEPEDHRVLFQGLYLKVCEVSSAIQGGWRISVGSVRLVPSPVLHFVIAKMISIRRHKASEMIQQVKALTASLTAWI